MNFAEYGVQLSTEKKYLSKYEYKYEYEYSIPGDHKASTDVHARERSGSVVDCLTRDRRAAGSSLTGVTALWR